MDISDLLAFSVKNKASDLHLSSGLPPMIRVHGDVRKIYDIKFSKQIRFKLDFCADKICKITCASFSVCGSIAG
jgi:Tfp pilus assembly pilus retraction ATPase PilT